MHDTDREQPLFGSDDLRLPGVLRSPLRAHLADLRERYRLRGWGGRVGFGERPAVVVIDLARFWLEPQQQIGSRLDAVVEAACQVLEATRSAQVPIFFTTFAHDPAHPVSPHDQKLRLDLPDDAGAFFALDARLKRRPT